MTVYSDFEHSINAAYSLIAMYKELRRSRNLGQRGRLNTENEDLLWLPRSSIVVAISALDAYVHSVLYERIPMALREDIIPNALADRMASIFPIKNGANFKSTFLVMSSDNSHIRLTEELIEKEMNYESYHSVKKIIEGYRLIGVNNIFSDVANLWPGPNTSDIHLKRSLESFVKRRNQIAHEGDRELSGRVRHIQPQYAKRVTDFIYTLVTHMNNIVYPSESTHENDAV